METIMDVIEGAYDSIGLMRTESAPMKRFLFTGGLTYGIVYVAQPESMFDQNGPRPWSLTSPDAPNATAFPHYLIPILAGFVGGFMV